MGESLLHCQAGGAELNQSLRFDFIIRGKTQAERGVASQRARPEYEAAHGELDVATAKQLRLIGQAFNLNTVGGR